MLLLIGVLPHSTPYNELIISPMTVSSLTRIEMFFYRLRVSANPLPKDAMITLCQLEDRLRREMPAITWACRSAEFSPLIPGTEIPENIDVTAIRLGETVAGSPWRVRGSMLMRWGLDATAKLLVKGFPARLQETAHRIGASWDKLAEI